MKKVAVFIGRFSVPHIGHYKVIDQMRKFINEHRCDNISPQPVVIIINGKKSSLDTNKNPLTVEERKKFMMASGKTNGVIFREASSAFDGLKQLKDDNFFPCVMACGGDRADTYRSLLERMFPNEHTNLLIVERNDTDIKSAASSSLAKRCVDLGFEDEFLDITGFKSSPKVGKILFNKIKNGRT